MFSPNTIDSPELPAAPAPARPTPRSAIFIAWLMVVLPALWGVSQTIRTSARLFQGASSPMTQKAPAGSSSAPHAP